MLFTVEIKDAAKSGQAEAAICLDDEGLEFLIDRLSRLRGKRDHEHMKTPSWAGQELSEAKQGGDEYDLIHHLRLVKF